MKQKLRKTSKYFAYNIIEIIIEVEQKILMYEN